MAVRRISGGAISGYSATGSWTMATRPMITMRIEMTIATIGRLMKNLAMASSAGYFGWLRAAGALFSAAGAAGAGVAGVTTAGVLKVAGSGSAGRGLTFSPCRTLSRHSTMMRAARLRRVVRIQRG